MEIERIYFDMDDVLVDFAGTVRKYCGLEIRGENAVDDDVLFEGIRKVDDFYERADPIRDSLKLFSVLRSEYGDRVEILTAVPKPSRNLPTIGRDKCEWVKKHLGEGIRVNIVLRRQKPDFVKGKGSVLIDDNKDNIKAWVEAGGTGILFTDAVSAEKAVMDLTKEDGDSIGINIAGTFSDP